MIVVDIISCVLLAVGLFFSFVGVLGLIRMPDVYGRLQASTCIPTLGVLCTAIGAILYAAIIMGSAGTAVKIGLIALLILLTNPIGSHSIAKGAYKAGIRPEKEMSVDDYGRDFE